MSNFLASFGEDLDDTGRPARPCSSARDSREASPPALSATLIPTPARWGAHRVPRARASPPIAAPPSPLLRDCRRPSKPHTEPRQPSHAVAPRATSITPWKLWSRGSFGNSVSAPSRSSAASARRFAWIISATRGNSVSRLVAPQSTAVPRSAENKKRAAVRRRRSLPCTRPEPKPCRCAGPACSRPAVTFAATVSCRF